MANVWVKTLDGHSVRHDRIVELAARNVPGRGWTVMGRLPGKEPPVMLAALGRGTRAKHGAERLCNEWPQAVAAAGKGVTVTFVKSGYPKGEGRWSTLAAEAAD